MKNFKLRINGIVLMLSLVLVITGFGVTQKESFASGKAKTIAYKVTPKMKTVVNYVPVLSQIPLDWLGTVEEGKTYSFNRIIPDTGNNNIGILPDPDYIEEAVNILYGNLIINGVRYHGITGEYYARNYPSLRLYKGSNGTFTVGEFGFIDFQVGYDIFENVYTNQQTSNLVPYTDAKAKLYKKGKLVKTYKIGAKGKKIKVKKGYKLKLINCTKKKLK